MSEFPDDDLVEPARPWDGLWIPVLVMIPLAYWLREDLLGGTGPGDSIRRT